MGGGETAAPILHDMESLNLRKLEDNNVNDTCSYFIFRSVDHLCFGYTHDLGGRRCIYVSMLVGMAGNLGSLSHLHTAWHMLLGKDDID